MIGKSRPDLLKLSTTFYDVSVLRNRFLKTRKAQIWAGGNAGVKANFRLIFIQPKKPPPQMVLCRYFQRDGRCRDGDRCRFAHAELVDKGEPFVTQIITDCGPSHMLHFQKTKNLSRYGLLSMYGFSTYVTLQCIKIFHGKTFGILQNICLAFNSKESGRIFMKHFVFTHPLGSVIKSQKLTKNTS